jgi:hypothetical protein
VEDCYKVNPSSPCFCVKQKEHLNWFSVEQSQIRTPQRELLKRDCDYKSVQFQVLWVARQSIFAKTKRSVNQSQLSQGMSQREIGLCLGSRYPGRVQTHQRKREKMTKIKVARGAAMTPNIGAKPTKTGVKPPTYGGHLRQCIVQPMNATRLQPYAQNPNPPPKKRHPKATKTVAVTRMGWHGNCHPSKPSYTQLLLAYTQTAVTAAVRLRVTVRMAVDTYPAITAEEGWFGHDFF